MWLFMLKCYDNVFIALSTKFLYSFLLIRSYYFKLNCLLLWYLFNYFFKLYFIRALSICLVFVTFMSWKEMTIALSAVYIIILILLMWKFVKMFVSRYLPRPLDRSALNLKQGQSSSTFIVTAKKPSTNMNLSRTVRPSTGRHGKATSCILHYFAIKILLTPVIIQ